MRAAAQTHERSRRGTVLIVTMWVVLALTGLLLVFVHRCRVEAAAAANRLAALQAEATAQGALQLLLARLEGLDGSVGALDEFHWEAQPLGDGYFWVIRPNLEDDELPDFGPLDEASRVNLNTAPRDTLALLPGMTDELADSLLDWRDADAEVSPSGAESEYYLLLDPAYYCKDAPLESPWEVLLVRGGSTDVLLGEDLNLNDVLDPNENDADRSPPADNADGSLDRGLLALTTTFSAEPNLAADGSRRVNVNARGDAQLIEVLSQAVPEDRLYTLLPGIRAGRPYRNLLDFYVRSGLTIEEFAQVADRLTTSDAEVLRGLINVNTAPRSVLMCLPGLEESDVDELLQKRSDPHTDLSNIAWVAEVLPPEKASEVGTHITTRSYQFSADIVAVSANGRAFRRYRAVVDTTQNPPRVLLWWDLTHLGWPLDPGILTSLRSGGSPGGQGRPA